MGTGNHRKTQLVVQTPEKMEAMEGLANVTLAAQTPPLPEGSKLEVVEMHAAQTLDRMLAQCALQPGLGGVYSEILEQGEGMEFYVVSCPNLAGESQHVTLTRRSNHPGLGVIDPIILSYSSHEFVLVRAFVFCNSIARKAVGYQHSRLVLTIKAHCCNMSTMQVKEAHLPAS